MVGGWDLSILVVPSEFLCLILRGKGVALCGGEGGSPFGNF